MQNKTILVLGSNGFLGKNFQEYIILNRLTEKYDFYFSDINGAENLIVSGCYFYEYDLLHFDNLNALILKTKPDFVINLTGTYGIPDLDLIYRSNTQITRNILEVLRQNNLTNIYTLLVGSAAEYGECKDLPILETSPLNPVNIYGLSKKHQTELALFYKDNYNLKIGLGRVFNTIGKYQSTSLSIASFISRIHELNDGDELVTGNIDTRRDFIDISDVISAFFSIIESGKSDIFNICSGTSSSIREILNFLIEISRKKIAIKTDMYDLRKNEILNSYGSNDKLKRTTGWNIKIDIKQTLKSLALNNKSN
jgi:GDP-4-dehydro-6-deoxy-D-mannose reductase